MNRPKPIIKRVLDAADDVGEFIAGPRPDNPIGGTYHDYTRWVCDSYANVPDWARTAASVAGWSNVDLGMQEVCKQYLGENYPEPDIPFTGGQCPTTYLVDLINVGSGPPFTGQVFAIGPIRGVQTRPGINPGTIFIDVLANPNVGYRTGNVGEVWEIASVSRIDNQPDVCGDPPATGPRAKPGAPTAPPSPPGGGQPPTFDPRGNPVFRPGPIENPYGDPIEFPPIDPFDPGAGDDDDPFDPEPPPPPPPPGDQGEPGEPEETDDDDENEVAGCAPAGSVLVGIKVDILEVPPFAREFAPGIYRGVAYIYLGGDSGLDQDYAGSMLSDGQFIFAEKENLTCYRVRANTGYKLRVTPYYREVEEE